MVQEYIREKEKYLGAEQIDRNRRNIFKYIWGNIWNHGKYLGTRKCLESGNYLGSAKYFDIILEQVIWSGMTFESREIFWIWEILGREENI